MLFIKQPPQPISIQKGNDLDDLSLKERIKKLFKLELKMNILNLAFLFSLCGFIELFLIFI